MGKLLSLFTGGSSTLIMIGVACLISASVAGYGAWTVRSWKANSDLDTIKIQMLQDANEANNQVQQEQLQLQKKLKEVQALNQKLTAERNLTSKKLQEVLQNAKENGEDRPIGLGLQRYINGLREQQNNH